MVIIEAVKHIRERIYEACLRSGRNPAEVALMGVSKFHGLAELEEAWEGGIRLFGENRVQEAAEKFTVFKKKQPEVEVHMIGALQRNKAKTAAALFDGIQSIDRDALIDELGVLTSGRDKPLMILLELHTGEDSKTGYPDVDSLCRAAERALSYPGLLLKGLMTMAPYTADQKSIRTSFRTLVSAKTLLESRFPGVDWSCLSMGMSGDFEIAIEEGSTLVRIGTAVFGERRT
ncbi:MAG: YggS family pyridoxal phosphate-dependent enzyme [Treponema sp.]|jgi:pyridoxal phosphate enzyme (YggS family)|nr:YggS family pyridoxal phosphate-dependent enzyme [Treponema sp.]